MSDDEVEAWPIGRLVGGAAVLSHKEFLGAMSLRSRTPASRPTPAGVSVGHVLAGQGALRHNWDGHGAIAPAVRVIRTADAFVDVLPPHMAPAISASVVGGVLLEWESDVVDLLVEVRNSGDVEALVSWPDGTEVEGPLKRVKQEVLDALAALLDPS